jgi:hypothetical protein
MFTCVTTNVVPSAFLKVRFFEGITKKIAVALPAIMIRRTPRTYAVARGRASGIGSSSGLNPGLVTDITLAHDYSQR